MVFQVAGFIVLHWTTRKPKGEWVKKYSDRLRGQLFPPFFASSGRSRIRWLN